MNERIAKLTSGIAKLTVRGASNGEVKEKRDRAEDAVCAVRAAIKYGALTGGGYTWVKLAEYLSSYSLDTPDKLRDIVVQEIVRPSILSVVERLFTNAGFTPEEARDLISKMTTEYKSFPQGPGRAYDIQQGAWVDPVDAGLLDSFSAVRDSLRNAISVSGTMGTTGGVVVFTRDAELERKEALESMEYMKAANYSEANERG